MAQQRRSHPTHVPNQRCHQTENPTGTSLTALNLSTTDYSVLMAARFFFSSFAKPSDAAWLSVVLGSAEFFPNHVDSPRVVQSVLSVVQEIRMSRKSILRFSSPHCLDCANVVTAEERHLLAMLQALRSGAVSRAVTDAMLLCEGNETDGVMRAVGVLIHDLANLRGGRGTSVM